MKELFDLINQSKIITIGYTHQFEDLKDEIISKLPARKLDVDNLKSSLRDIRLDTIINNSNIEWIIVDRAIHQTFERFNKVVEHLSRLNLGYKLIIECQMYRTANTDTDELKYQIAGGNSPMYFSDLVIALNDNKHIKIIKNRFSDLQLLELIETPRLF